MKKIIMLVLFQIKTMIVLLVVVSKINLMKKWLILGVLVKTQMTKTAYTVKKVW